MPCWRLASLVVALALPLGGACSRASDESEAKKWAADPPPQQAQPPADLAIDITIDGAASGKITAQTLTGAKPDFQDAERTAWLIKTLIPGASPTGTVVEAASPNGVIVKFERPSAAGIEPVLFLTRRGDVIVSAIDPKDPFPRYHGQGGRLRRAGDSWPRVAPVARVAITRPTP